jgi:hypothetical protein
MRPLRLVLLIQAAGNATWATDWTTDFRQEEEIFLLSTTSRQATGPIQWVPEALFLEVNQPERESGHSPQSNAKVNNFWSYVSTTPDNFVSW